MSKNRIGELRKKRGMGQKELAEKIETSQQAISLYERGDREPKLETWQKLAKFFDVPVTYLMGISDINNLDIYDNFDDWLNTVAIKKSDSTGAIVPRKELKAYVNELTLKEFESLLKSSVYGNEKELEELREKLSSVSEMKHINSFTRHSFTLALKAKTGDSRAQQAYKEISKIINSYYGYNVEEDMYVFKGKDNK